jgi:hypothetical protein
MRSSLKGLQSNSGFPVSLFTTVGDKIGNILVSRMSKKGNRADYPHHCEVHISKWRALCDFGCESALAARLTGAFEDDADKPVTKLYNERCRVSYRTISSRDSGKNYFARIVLPESSE